MVKEKYIKYLNKKNNTHKLTLNLKQFFGVKYDFFRQSEIISFH